MLWEQACRGNGEARSAFYEMAFRQLRKIASSLLRRERAGYTIQPTALVSELFLKLHRLESQIATHQHFYALAARAMRQVLVDRARVKAAEKNKPCLPELMRRAAVEPVDSESSLAVLTVLDRLRAVDAIAADTIWMRTVEELTLEEVSLRQGRKICNVRADYDAGIAWMRNRLS
jgi:RNA polymerase sigma factor (TIGR02999 family)